MIYIKTSKKNTQEIDIHGFTVTEAKKLLERTLSSLNGNVKELRVIHGYSSDKLQQMVRLNLVHRRIKYRMKSLNPGETILILN